MPTDFITPMQFGAGLVARGQQLRAQRQQMEQEEALFPLKKMEIERGLKAKALEIEQAQWKQEVFLQNKAGLVEAWKLAAEPEFFANPIVARSKLAGLSTRFPYLTADPAFSELIKGVQSAELGARVKQHADATLEAAKIRSANSFMAALLRSGSSVGKSTGGFAPSNIEKEWNFAQKLREQADKLETEGNLDEAQRLRTQADSYEKRHNAHLNELSSSALSALLNSGDDILIQMAKDELKMRLLNQWKKPPMDSKPVTPISSPAISNPPPLNNEPLRWNPESGWNR